MLNFVFKECSHENFKQYQRNRAFTDVHKPIKLKFRETNWKFEKKSTHKWMIGEANITFMMINSFKSVGEITLALSKCFGDVTKTKTVLVFFCCYRKIHNKVCLFFLKLNHSMFRIVCCEWVIEIDENESLKGVERQI